MWRRKNYLGETRKQEILRRLKAAEEHLMDLEERFREDKYMHLLEFHANQAGYTKRPEE